MAKFICKKHNPLQPNSCLTCAIAAKENADRQNVLPVEYINPDVSTCAECGCSCGVHLVICHEFRCDLCGQGGPAPDHNGGCPCKPRSIAGQVAKASAV
jgi:hypothetical protein